MFSMADRRYIKELDSFVLVKLNREIHLMPCQTTMSAFLESNIRQLGVEAYVQSRRGLYFEYLQPFKAVQSALKKAVSPNAAPEVITHWQESKEKLMKDAVEKADAYLFKFTKQTKQTLKHVWDCVKSADAIETYQKLRKRSIAPFIMDSRANRRQFILSLFQKPFEPKRTSNYFRLYSIYWHDEEV